MLRPVVEECTISTHSYMPTYNCQDLTQFDLPPLLMIPTPLSLRNIFPEYLHLLSYEEMCFNVLFNQIMPLQRKCHSMKETKKMTPKGVSRM